MAKRKVTFIDEIEESSPSYPRDSVKEFGITKTRLQKIVVNALRPSKVATRNRKSRQAATPKTTQNDTAYSIYIHYSFLFIIE